MTPVVPTLDLAVLIDVRSVDRPVASGCSVMALQFSAFLASIQIYDNQRHRSIG
jgi:hypothetical protein